MVYHILIASSLYDSFHLAVVFMNSIDAKADCGNTMQSKHPEKVKDHR